MSDLESMIRKLADKGELTYLSIAPRAGKGKHNIIWSARYAPATAWGHGVGEHADPVEALKLAIADKSTIKMMRELKVGTPKRKAAESADDDDNLGLPPE